MPFVKELLTPDDELGSVFGGRMNSKQLFERKDRSVVTPFEIKGSVTTNGEKHCEVVLIWNISDSGLCIWTDAAFKKGGRVALSITFPWTVSFDCEVRWCRTVPDRSGYILGLHATSNQEKLVSIHKELVDRQKKAV